MYLCNIWIKLKAVYLIFTKFKNVYVIVYVCTKLGGEDIRAVTELGFGHVTTKTWAYFGVFGFFRYKFWRKNLFPPQPNHFLKIQWKILLVGIANFWTNYSIFF